MRAAFGYRLLKLGYIVSLIFLTMYSISLLTNYIRKEFQLSVNPACDALIAGNARQINITKQIMTREVRFSITEEELFEMAHDCTTFRYTHGFLAKTLPSKPELDFPIAYIITVHKNAQQLIRLLRAIYAPQNVYCIHIDIKSAILFQKAIQEVVHCFPNIFIASKLENVVYAGFNRLKADINCLQDLIRPSLKWKYVINLCGQDFPIKTNLDIVQYLAHLDGKNDIAGVIPNHEIQLNHFKYIHEIRSKNGKETVVPTSKLKTAPPHNITIFFGSAYNMLSRRFVEHILSNNVAQDLLKWMEDVHTPDEYYWVTLNRLSEMPGGSLKPSWGSRARAIKWSFFEGKHHEPCHGVYQRSVCIYGVGDLKWLIEKHHLFANKFDLDVDHVVLRCLDYHLHRTYIAQRNQLS